MEQATCPSQEIEAGARNLLSACANAKPGDRVLLVGEDDPKPYFEPELCEDVARVARALDLIPEIVIVPPVASAEMFPQAVADAMQNAEITIFFSRLGDQVRFCKTPGTGKVIMAYTLTRAHLASPFASLSFRHTEKILAKLEQVILAADSYRISGADGTDMHSRLRGEDGADPLTPFTVRLFPTMIFAPVNFVGLSGRLVIDHFTLSSSTRAYDDSVLMIAEPFTVQLEGGRMVGFEGDPDSIAAFKSQCERAARLTGGDPFVINSWHTGINPFTFFDGDIHEDLERWGTVSYGSPRYTHLHAAGKDPGDISIQLFDATISFDGEVIWDQGRFVFLDRPDIREILADAGAAHIDSGTRLDIGV